MSLCPNTSAAVATRVAPAPPNASSPNDAASPAPRSTRTEKPAFTSRPATSGVKATRRSLAAVSFGTPIFMNPQDGVDETATNVSALRRRSPLPHLCQQAFREVEPLRQLAHLRLEPEHTIFEVRHTTLRRAGPDHGISHGVGDLPPGHAPPIAVTEVARGHHDDVAHVPDPHAPVREAHPDAALDAPSVEPEIGRASCRERV